MPKYDRDPELAAIVEPKSRRNILAAAQPEPLAVDTTSGRPVAFVLQMVNGPATGIDLAIAADEPWLEPQTSRVTLHRGQTGECGILARPEGDTEFANLLLFWEGTQSTLCQSVLVRRRLGAPILSRNTAPGGESAPHSTLTKRQHAEAVRALETLIDGCGGSDMFIDTGEENSIFRRGGALELGLKEIEALLGRRCTEGGWSRQVRLSEKLTSLLEEATKDDGVIDEREYEDVLAFAATRRMPRKDADEHCVTIILNNGWKVKEGVLNKWFAKKRKHFGL